jgi:NADH dehydrogenase/NADH:ubiquinone oxidoreductase subunit G
MSEMVKVTIDGKNIQVPKGTNLIDAAEQAGVHVPNLCYLKGMKGIGACRLCLVEVEGAKAPVVACNTKVKDGMNVTTKTDAIEEARKFVIDLILSMHPLDCMTCTKAGVCNLQQYAYDFEIKESSFTRKKFGYPTDEANPFIRRDPEYCILCARCVRACQEQGTNVLDFMGRGVGAKVATANDKPLQESECTFCGSCVDACPVNALLEGDRWRRGREWDYEKASSVCMLCGNGCDITVSTKEGRVQKVNAGAVDGSAEKYICAYGRFGFDCIESETRLTKPMIKKNGKLKETSWNDAMSLVAEKLKDAGAGTGFISTAGIQNEDAVTLKKFARDVVKTKNCDTTMGLYSDAESLVNSGNADIDSADIILMVDLDTSQQKRVLPALDAAVRRMVSRGSKLIVVNSSDTEMEKIASISLKGSETELLKALIKSAIDQGQKADKKLSSAVGDAKVTDEAQKAAELFVGAKNPVVFTSPSLFDAASNIAILKGSAVAVPLESNARGVAMLGLKTKGLTYSQMVSGETKMLYAVGEVPISKRPKTGFLVVQGTHLTELAKQADIVLPAAAFLEASGTMVDYTGRLKHLPQVVEPQGESKSHREILVQLSKALGSPIKKPTEAEIKKAVKIKAKPALRPFEKKKGFDVSSSELIESINSSVINGSRLLWLREAQPASK